MICFERFTLDTDNMVLYFEGEQVVDNSRVIDLLVILLNQPKQLHQKDALMTALWPNRVVTEGSLLKLCSELRLLLAKYCPDIDFVITVRGRGIKFNPVIEISYDAGHDKSNMVNKSRWILLLILLLVGLAISVYWLTPERDNPVVIADSRGEIFAIMPVEMTILDDKYQWAKYGLMTVVTQGLSKAGIAIKTPSHTINGLKYISEPTINNLCQHLACDGAIQLTLSKNDRLFTLRYDYFDGDDVTALTFSHARIELAVQAVVVSLISTLSPNKVLPDDFSPFYSDDAAANLDFSIAMSEILQGEEQRAIDYLLLALKRVPTFTIAKLYLAHAYYQLGDIDKSSGIIDEVEPSALDLNGHLLYLNVKSNIMYSRGDLQSSILFSQKILSTISDGSHPEVAGNTLMNIGTSWQAMGNNELAREYLQQALALFVEHGLSMRHAQALFNYANSYAGSDNEGDLRNARTLYQQALTKFEQLNMAHYAAIVRRQLMFYYIEEGRYLKAREGYAVLLAYYNKINDLPSALMTISDIAEVAIKEQKWQEATRLATQIYQQHQGTLQVKMLAATQLSRIHMHQQQLTLAAPFVQEVSNAQWQDSRPIAMLLRSIYLHELGNFEGALRLAIATKSAKASSWQDEHQVMLDQLTIAAAENKAQDLQY